MPTPLDYNALGPAIRRLNTFAMDSAGGLFAAQLATVTLAEVFKHQYPQTQWTNGTLASISTAGGAGALVIGYTELSGVGNAKIVAEDATDIPITDVEGEYNTHKVHTVAAAFSYTTQQVRFGQQNGGVAGMFDVIQEKAFNCREAHDSELNNLIRAGSAPHKLQGYTNAKGIFVIPAATPDWMSASASQIVTAFSAAAMYGRMETDNTEIPDTAVFPIDVFGRLETLQNSAASDATVLDFLKRTHPHITRWVSDFGMGTAGAGGSKAVLIYNRAPNKARAAVPMLLRPLAPEVAGLTFKVVMESRFAGVMTPKPKSITRVDSV